MMPEGWIRSRISEIANVQVGRDLVEDRFSEFQSEKYKYPVYSNTVEARGLYGFYDFPEYPGNAVTVVGRGIGLGRAFARDENDSFGAIGRLLVLTPKNNSFDVGFLADYINFSLRIHNESGGIPQLPGASLSKYFVTLPSLPEQKKIAKILSTWDKAITTTEQLITNSLQQKKALMQQLFTGKKRLLDKNGERFNGDWSRIEIGNYLIESRTPSIANDPSKRLTVRLNLKGIEVREVRGTEAVDSTAYFVRKAGQFIYGKQNIHKGAFGIIPATLDGFETSQDLPAFDFNGTCDSTWFFYYISQESFYTALENKMSGTGSKRLSPAAFFKLKLKSPCIEEQQKIAAVLTAADKKITVLQQNLIALKHEKKALMQQLLTGKRGVKTTEDI